MDMIAQLSPRKVVDIYTELINPIEISQTQSSSCHGMRSTSKGGVGPTEVEDEIRSKKGKSALC